MNFISKLRHRRLEGSGTSSVISVIVTSLMALSFVGVTFFVMFATGSQKYFHFSNILFTIVWVALLSSIILILPRKVGRLIYAIVYPLLLIYGMAQYVYYQLFNKLFSFTVLSNIDEGAGYVGEVFSTVGILHLTVFFLLFLLGICVFFGIKHIGKLPNTPRVVLLPLMILVMIVAQIVFPRFYGPMTDKAVWNSFEDLRYIYENNIDRHKVLGMSGYYQYLGIDFYNCFIKPMVKDDSDLIENIDEFFADYQSEHTDTDMTGLFEGKNAIIVMMESVDYLALTEENTPTLYMMMQNGISFTNYYASVFGDGATFSNEFVLNTGVYSASNGTAAYSFVDNTFSYSLPSLFRNSGYTANSFHFNNGWFYNRATMHDAFGYEKYNSYFDYGGSSGEVTIDTYLTRTPELLGDVLSQRDGNDSPFLSFIITYSAHLGYTYDSELAEYAFDTYVSPNDVLSDREDVSVLMAKARITDRMMEELVASVDENTVIICVTDHYAYGLTEETQLETSGDIWALRQKVPFFIYCKAMDQPPIQVDKLCSNSDFLPTVANLFGLDVPENLLGHDVFDPGYEGFVVFSNYSFLTDEVYWHDRVQVAYNDNYSEEKVNRMIEYVYRRIPINDSILKSDYYSRVD